MVFMGQGLGLISHDEGRPVRRHQGLARIKIRVDLREVEKYFFTNTNSYAWQSVKIFKPRINSKDMTYTLLRTRQFDKMSKMDLRYSSRTLNSTQ